MEEKLLDSLRACRVAYSEALHELKSKNQEIVAKDKMIENSQKAHLECHNDFIEFITIVQVLCVLVVFLLLTAIYFRKTSLFFKKIKQILWKRK